MSILSWFRSEPAGLVCPRCEKPIEGHDDAACERRMSRRFFFQAVAGAAVAVSVAPQIITELAEGLVKPSGNTFLTINQINFEMLKVLHNNTDLARRLTRRYDSEFAKEGRKIGDTLHIRKPLHYPIIG